MVEGIKGPGASDKPHPIGEDSTKQELVKAMETPVHTLGQLKQVLIQSLGEEKGKKLYNHFLMSLVASMLSQIRQSQQSADQATKSMGQTQS